MIPKARGDRGGVLMIEEVSAQGFIEPVLGKAGLGKIAGRVGLDMKLFSQLITLLLNS